MRIKRILSLAASLAVSLTAALPAVSHAQTLVVTAAVSKDYAPQLMHIALHDDAANLAAADTADKAPVAAQTENGALTEQWRIDYCGANDSGSYYKIVNAASGRLLTPMGYQVSAGSEAVIYGNENDHSQYWYISAVDKDAHGNDLHYKIANYADPTLVLTNSSAGTELAAFSGADAQKWLLNPVGLQGFAGYCKNDNTGNVKAADIGGLLGETVEVDNFNDLKKYTADDIPRTIVVTSNITVDALAKDSSGRYYCPDGRIYVHSNKTIIGSYAAHTLYNVQFCTATNKGVGNNFILKNFELRHDAESNGNDSIVVYFGSGQNLWVDHCTFAGHSDYNKASTGLEDYDKFFACCYDADYCTVSDNAFGLHEYGLILGYPADDDNAYSKYNDFPRMSILGNLFDRTLTRAPGLMRYGYFHSMNNYVNHFSMAYTVYTASKVYAESCVYENGGNVICDWDQTSRPGAYAESGSKSSGCKRTTIEGQAQNCTWRPSTNYNYKVLSADQAKEHCSSNTGAKSQSSAMAYIGQQVGVPSAGLMVGPDDTWQITPISAFETIEAETFSKQEGIRVEELSTGGKNIGYVESGDYIMFRNVDFGEGASSFKALVSGNPCTIEIHLGAIGDTPHAALAFEGTSGYDDYREIAFTIPTITGTDNLYLRFTGGESYLLNMDSFVFGAEALPVLGDVNADGALTLADAVMLHKWLAAIPGASLTDRQAADLNGDSTLDARDLSMLKALLLGTA